MSDRSYVYRDSQQARADRLQAERDALRETLRAIQAVAVMAQNHRAESVRLDWLREIENRALATAAGGDDLGQNPSGVPRVNEVTFTVAAPPEPPLPVNSARLALEQFAKSSLGKNAFKTWEAANPAEARNLANGDLAANHYATRFGKFLVYLRQAAAQ